ncbi:type II toxin-antitoxin system PemK/MazF family toxin [Dyadobacter sp. CY356]|uniref:type II toxin-antitoxin system PemK/MazF family toxin n=1 Tax=Dyadobacter sp. CY356 TaxID=2906442 RepID=UPI001F2D2B08|nr:type II toxin-antitoxin system PemK/MazF family toxin [Dyadobacter sp. CY356]MCF0059797.1 type II toxin-antitoxin system PemK/MazF family toxin [Dyadobacter sp. CY356]
MKKGDIVLIPFPFTNLKDVKIRPALILISTDLDVTVAFITTQIKWQEKDDVMIEPSILNGLKKASLIRLSKLTTIDKTLVIGKFGVLETSELKQINASLIKLFDL